MLAPILVSYLFLQQCCSKTRRVSFRALFGDRTTLDHEIDGFRDVGGMIANALDVLGTKHKMHTERDVTRIFHHVSQKLAEQRSTDGVDFLVAVPHRQRAGEVATGIGVKHLLEQGGYERSHVLDAADQLLRMQIQVERNN